MEKIFNFVSKKQLAMQSIILWILAIANCGGNQFWMFAIPAIITGGMQDILNELRDKKENT
jgi:hypothetical protein